MTDHAVTDLADEAHPTAEPRPRIVIEPSSGAIDWPELWRARELFFILAERDIRLRYRQTALGVVWVILQPLAASVIFATIFGLFAKLPSNGVPYVLFVYTALLPWNLFSGGIQRAGISLLNSSNLITKIYLPRAIIPLASLSATLLDFAVAGIVLLVLMAIFGAAPSLALLGIPALVALALLAAAGVTLLVSSLAVYYRDFSNALPFVLQIWLYGSPVVYASSLVPERFQMLYALNPMVGVIDGFRWVVLGGAFPGAEILESLAVSVLLLLLGATVFGRIERRFADVI